MKKPRPVKPVPDKIDKATFLKLKVYRNKTTGQASIVLPKKKVKVIPKKVRVSW